MRLVVGLTGGIACGKSYVSNFLINKGYKVVDTDKISHDLYKNDIFMNLLEQYIPEAFVNGVLDKKLLREIVFSNKSKLDILNALSHPLIYKRCEEEIEKSDGIIFIDAPILFEANFNTLCDLTVCVYTTKVIQLKRLIERDNISESLAKKIIKSQMNLEEKKNKCDLLIKSEEDFSKTDQNILHVLERIKDYGKGL